MPRSSAPQCGQPWSTIYVQWDGKVTRPCIRGPQNLGALPPGGDVLEFWNGATYAEIRRQVRDGSGLGEACAACFSDPTRIIDHFTPLAGDVGSFGIRKTENFYAAALRHRTGDETASAGPVVVILDLSSKCNVRCTKCFIYHSEMQYRLGHMSMETFRQVEPLLDTAMLVVGHENGESLLNKNFDAMVATIKNKNCKFLFNTTGQLLTEERSRHLVRYGVDRVMFSIDSLVPKLYQRMHKGGSFDKLMQNIEALDRAKRYYSSTLPEIGWYFVACRSNLTELPEMVHTASSLGFSSFFVSHLNKPTHEQWKSYHDYYAAESLADNEDDRAAFRSARDASEIMAQHLGMEFYAGAF